MKARGEAVFNGVLIIIFAGGLYLCRDWSVKARLFPLLIVIAGVTLSVLMVISDSISSTHPDKKRKKAKRDELKTGLESIRENITPKSEMIMILWVAGFLGMILVFGFWIAIATFTPLFMPLFGRENWKMVAIFTVGIWLGIYLVFGLAMQVSLYGGALGITW